MKSEHLLVLALQLTFKILAKYLNTIAHVLSKMWNSPIYLYVIVFGEVLSRYGHTHVHKLAGELECGRLKAQVTWRAGQDEAKINVNDVALRIQQNVPVMSAE